MIVMGMTDQDLIGFGYQLLAVIPLALKGKEAGFNKPWSGRLGKGSMTM